jgi:hypothetical protein
LNTPKEINESSSIIKNIKKNSQKKKLALIVTGGLLAGLVVILGIKSLK